jgi:hypothetical protein
VHDVLGDALNPNDEFLNNGIFFMDVASYHRDFSMTAINLDTQGWNFDYHLMLDDE